MSADPAELEIRRAPRIKAEDVFAAADALLLDGHRPTIDRVRMKLGRGSPNTINEHLDRWWSNLGARLRDLPGQVLPGLPEAVTNALLQLWHLAVRESHQALRGFLDQRETAFATTAAELDAAPGGRNRQSVANATAGAGRRSGESAAPVTDGPAGTGKRASAGGGARRPSAPPGTPAADGEPARASAPHFAIEELGLYIHTDKGVGA